MRFKMETGLNENKEWYKKIFEHDNHESITETFFSQN